MLGGVQCGGRWKKVASRTAGLSPLLNSGCSTCTPLMRWSATLGFGVGYGVRDYVSRQRHCHHRERNSY
jgi:hypothetical protein